MTVQLQAQGAGNQPAEPPPEVAFSRLETLWVNTGTLCNIACLNCFMGSTPTNDSLAYFSLANFRAVLADAPPCLGEIGFTGGEPFMNPEIMPMLAVALNAGLRVLVLTNAMRPMQRHALALARLIAAHRVKLTIRVSLDHYLPERHEALRGAASFGPAMEGVKFLVAAGAKLKVAARSPWESVKPLCAAALPGCSPHTESSWTLITRLILWCFQKWMRALARRA